MEFIILFIFIAGNSVYQQYFPLSSKALVATSMTQAAVPLQKAASCLSQVFLAGFVAWKSHKYRSLASSPLQTAYRISLLIWTHKDCLGVRQNWRRPTGSNLIGCREHLLLSHNTIWKITGLSLSRYACFPSAFVSSR